MSNEVVPVVSERRHAAVATLTTAFSADPIFRWIYPRAADYLENFPRLMLAFGGVAFDQATVWGFEDLTGVGMWMRPGTEPDAEATVGVLEATADPGCLDDLMALFGQMTEAHPDYPLWYLAWLGVDCALQGQGLGAKLMWPCLELVDGQQLPSYLDSTNPRNVSFYQRFGFEVVGVSQSGSSPPITSMLRPARTG